MIDFVGLPRSLKFSSSVDLYEVSLGLTHLTARQCGRINVKYSCEIKKTEMLKDYRRITSFNHLTVM